MLFENKRQKASFLFALVIFRAARKEHWHLVDFYEHIWKEKLVSILWLHNLIGLLLQICLFSAPLMKIYLVTKQGVLSFSFANSSADKAAEMLTALVPNVFRSSQGEVELEGHTVELLFVLSLIEGLVHLNDQALS